MVVWWIVSLIILIVCIVFAYRMIVSTYEFLPADKRYFLKFTRAASVNETITVQKDVYKSLAKKAKAAENDAAVYEMQLLKVQERLHALEEMNKFQSFPVKKIQQEKDSEEDWKELYYEENEKKEKLENELDFTKQKLDEVENTLEEISKTGFSAGEMKSDYESSLNNIHSLQNHISLLQRQLEAAAEREKELEQLLLSEISLRERYSLLQREYVELQSEADDLRRRILDISKKDASLQVQVVHLNELQSKLSLCENEKEKLEITLNELLKQNEKLLTEYRNN